jgi:hypothetical protein
VLPPERGKPAKNRKQNPERPEKPGKKPERTGGNPEKPEVARRPGNLEQPE